MIKNSQPFGKKFQKTAGGIFFDSHCIYVNIRRDSILTCIYGGSCHLKITAKMIHTLIYK